MKTPQVEDNAVPMHKTDEAFKAAIERFFEPMLHLFTPELHQAIDWSRGYEMLGTKLRFEFISVKLLDFTSRMEELEQSDNPFALIVLAHLKALLTRKDMRLRLSEKLGLMRALLVRGYNLEQANALFALLDMLVALPKHLELEVDRQLQVRRAVILNMLDEFVSEVEQLSR